MSTATLAPPTVAEKIAAARAEMHAGMALAETGDQADWDRKLIDQGITAFALTGEPFSANDLRDLLPDVRTTLMGSRFYAASVREEIRKVGDATSTKKNTHAKPVALWIGTTSQVEPEPEDDAPLPPAGGYSAFLSARAQLGNAGGFTPTVMPDHLFDFQQDLVEYAVRQGRAGLFADCGLGKTPMALAWAENVHRRTGRPVLFLTPLAVGFQVVAEAHRFGHDAALSRDGRPTAPITVTNYEQLGKFASTDFSGVVCDESSILKAFDGTTRAQITEFMRQLPYRLLSTATAAPNDYTELGTSSEALGGLGHTDMLTRFFTNANRTVTNRARFAATSRDVGWRLKGHAEDPFWQWVASWARAIRRPSDYGYDDGRFVLPELLEHQLLVDPDGTRDGELFDLPAVGLAEERAETRRTLTERCEAAAEVLAAGGPGVAWCHLNDESTLLVRLIPGSVEVAGSDKPEVKEEKLAAFTRGEIRILVTKPSIGAWGLNWQHAHRMTYFPTHSYESYYQSIRRMWRFGQTSPVQVHVVTTPGGRNVMANLHRKAEQADRMFTALVAHMNAAAAAPTRAYTTPLEVPAWLAS